jgi:hypothetical protein
MFVANGCPYFLGMSIGAAWFIDCVFRVCFDINLITPWEIEQGKSLVLPQFGRDGHLTHTKAIWIANHNGASARREEPMSSLSSLMNPQSVHECMVSLHSLIGKLWI